MDGRGSSLDAKVTADYLGQSQRILEEFRKQLDWEWQLVSSADGIKIMNHQSEDPKLPPIWFLEGICEAPLEILEEFCLIPENRKKWDSSAEESQRLVTLQQAPFVDVVYYATRALAGGTISSREFVDLRIEVREENRVIQAGASVDFPGLPVKKGFVRGWDYPCGFLMEKLDEYRSRLVVTTQHDVRGWIPTSIARSGTHKHLMQLAKDFKSNSEALARERKKVSVLMTS